jgi:hypothetical protein
MKTLKTIHFSIAFLLLVSLTLSAGGRTFRIQHSFDQREFKTGDILLQHIPSHLTSVIKDATNSQYSHCGMVVYLHNKIYVLEAIGPVKYTPLNRWLKQGRDNYTQIRPLNMDRRKIARVIQEAEKMLGKPYDIQYDLDEEKIYCSELLYKAFLRGAGMKIGKIEKLGDLNWKPHEKFIRYLCKGELPLDREMVTPESLVHDKKFELVRSTFPKRSVPRDDDKNPIRNLSGEWKGQYTLNKMVINIELKFRKKSEFISGKFILPNRKTVAIKSLDVIFSEENNQHAAIIIDERKVRGDMTFAIRDNGQRIIGTWKDNHYNIGNFSLERVTPLNLTKIIIPNIPPREDKEPKKDFHTIADKLERLHDLKTKKVISEAEYKTLKAKLLKEMD